MTNKEFNTQMGKKLPKFNKSNKFWFKAIIFTIFTVFLLAYNVGVYHIQGKIDFKQNLINSLLWVLMIATFLVSYLISRFDAVQYDTIIKYSDRMFITVTNGTHLNLLVFGQPINKPSELLSKLHHSTFNKKMAMPTLCRLDNVNKAVKVKKALIEHGDNLQESRIISSMVNNILEDVEPEPRITKEDKEALKKMSWNIYN